MPLKIKIFVWQQLRDHLPSGIEVLKQNGPGNDLCPLCNVPEMGPHIMLFCIMTQALWSFVREALRPDWDDPGWSQMPLILAYLHGDDVDLTDDSQ